MRAEFLEAGATAKMLARFMSEYEEFHWAVAWGSSTESAKLLLKHSSKFRTVIFGVAFSQTDPDLIDSLVRVKNAFVATRFDRGTFHPKLYCFRSKDQAAAIVGSANFTGGGLGRNSEAAVALSGRSDDRLFRDLFAFVERGRQYCQPVTEEFAQAYRISCKRAARLPKPPRDPLAGIDRNLVSRASTPLALVSWQNYLQQVRSSPQHDLHQSLQLLRIARKWFSSVDSFADLTAPQRKAIAGVLGDYQKLDPELDRDWGWFGSMKGAGDFANRIEQNDKYLARAVDSIPRQGDVTREQYQRFLEDFERAFARSDRVGRVPTASRLLAMKRPDTFLCVCKPNIVRASATLGFARTTLSPGNYWERIVEPIRYAEWYSSPRPPNRIESEIWDARAAMLDAIFYDPGR